VPANLADSRVAAETATAFVAGLVGAAIAVPLGDWMLRANGNQILTVTSLTELPVVAGTAALLAVTAVLALAVGAPCFGGVPRRSRL